MPVELTIGLLQEGEVREAAGLIQRVFGEFVAPAYVQEGRDFFLEYIEPDNFAKRSREGDHLALTAKIDNKIIGVIEIRGWNHICLFFVDKEHHKNGIARRLLQEAVRLCKENGGEEIDVNSSPFAAPVYERLGFARTGDEHVKNGIRFIPMRRAL